MPEFDEVLDGFGDNFKKNFKKPGFKIALFGVAGLGLFALYKNMQSDTATAAGGGEYYIPTGYASGYPELSGDSAGGYDGLYGQLDAMQGSMDTSNDSLSSQLDKINDKLGEQEALNVTLQNQIIRQNVVSEMKANSELYNAITGAAHADLKNQLHDRNMELAAEIGATFDPETGNYFDNETGSVLYTVAGQKATVAENYKPKGSSNPAKLYVTDKTTKKVTTSSYADDMTALSKAGDAFNKAQAAGDKAGMDKAHADAEAIRAKYGYSGGEDGSQQLALAD